MRDVTVPVMTTVNAPYRAKLSARQLAEKIADTKSADEFVVQVYAFFSEVPPTLQAQFITAMGVDMTEARRVAKIFARLSGQQLPLAA
ncbi:MAG: hypothetical protein PW843_28140 [Azospirillaceae bacterium]|nr:hypothetical protein [Azospirillaceae bacterium]